MRPRDATVPFFLWIACAILFHLSSRNGAEQVMKVVEEKRDLRRFTAEVRREVRLQTRPVEIALLQQPTVAPPEPTAEDAPVKPPKPKKTEPPKPKPEVKPEEKPPEVKPPEPTQKQAEKKPDEKKAEPDKKPPPELTLPPKRSIAVRQNVKDQNQPDNKDAEFLGDKNNKVDEQTQARITSTDQNEENPTPGQKHQGADKAPGNADESRVASAAGTEDEGSPLPPEAAKPTPVPPQTNPTTATPPRTQATPNEPRTAQAPPAPKPVDEKPTSLPAPQIVGGDQGESFSAATPNTSPKPPTKRLPPPPQKNRYSYGSGLGSGQTTDNGINLNLSFNQAQAVVGNEQLQKDRKADALRLRSKHRGSWAMAGLNKWKSAIENYVPHVKPGNQTALNTRSSPFATYLNSMHQRIHVIFADSFLPALDQLPKNHPLNNYDMHTDVEIILNQNDGGVVTMGIVKTSGATAFDVNALEAVSKAAPFGKPPSEIVSFDGNVYLHWEFHRNPDYACSTWFAYPYILKGPSKAPTQPEKPPAPRRNLEHAPGEFVPTGFTVPTRTPSGRALQFN